MRAAFQLPRRASPDKEKREKDKARVEAQRLEEQKLAQTDYQLQKLWQVRNLDRSFRCGSQAQYEHTLLTR